MNIAEYIADYLATRGCTHAFGIVGGANLLLFEAIARRMEVVSMCHEQAAAIASSYHYKACRRIAPCLVTAGGGAANAITGVIEAHMDGIPLLVISGNELTRFMRAPRTRTIGFQGFDPCDFVRTKTKLCVSVDNEIAAKHSIDTLYRTAIAHRQGACWLDIPQDISAKDAAVIETEDERWRDRAPA